MPILGKDADMIIVDDPHHPDLDDPKTKMEDMRKWFDHIVADPHLDPSIKDCPTLNCPFGRDVDTLILCKSDHHMIWAIKALRLKARYEVWTAALTGSRFKKIIWLAGRGDSEMEASVIETMLKEYFPTKLEPGGEMFVL